MRSFKRLLPVFWGLVLVSVAGCSGSRALAPRPELPEAFPHHSLLQIQQHLRPTALDTLLAFTAKASLSIRSPQQNANLTADIRHRRNDSLYMTLSPGLGLEAARILITPDSFFVHDRINKRLMYGNLEDASAQLPFPVTGDDIFLGLLGLLSPDDQTNWQLDADSAHYHLRDPERDRLFVIDPALWRVVRYEERDEQGDLVEARVFEEFDQFEHLFLPREVTFRRPSQETSATLYYRSLNLSPTTVSFPSRIGEGADPVLITGPQ